MKERKLFGIFHLHDWGKWESPHSTVGIYMEQTRTCKTCNEKITRKIGLQKEFK